MLIHLRLRYSTLGGLLMPPIHRTYQRVVNLGGLTMFGARSFLELGWSLAWRTPSGTIESQS